MVSQRTKTLKSYLWRRMLSLGVLRNVLSFKRLYWYEEISVLLTRPHVGRSFFPYVCLSSLEEDPCAVEERRKGLARLGTWLRSSKFEDMQPQRLQSGVGIWNSLHGSFHALSILKIRWKGHSFRRYPIFHNIRWKNGYIHWRTWKICISVAFSEAISKNRHKLVIS